MKKIYSFSKQLVLGIFLISSYLSSAQFNYIAGGSAGANLTSGDFNTMVGVNSGYMDQTGTANAFFGYAAGYHNLVDNNTFIGVEAGFYNSTGTGNTFIGESAGSNNVSGINNTMLGSEAGVFSTANNNTFSGFNAGWHTTSGASNSFTGSYAGFGNVIGTLNSFYGASAGYQNTSGSSNTFMGNNAGYLNGTANNNSFFGTNAGRSNTASDNVFVGNNAGSSNTSGTQNSFLGSASGATNTTGAYNIFIGTYAGKMNTSGAKNSYLGIGSGSANVDGSRNTTIGYYANLPAGSTLNNATAIGALAYVSASNSLVLGAINGVNGATSSTNVGVGTSSPSYLFHVNGVAAKPGGGSWTVASDSRLKKNVEDFNDGLAIVNKIRPVTFQYNGKAGMPTDKKFVGVIAQEMQKVAPYTVGKFQYSDTTGKTEEYLDYDANAITYVLINAVKEQQKIIFQQQTQLDTQQKQIDQLIATSQGSGPKGTLSGANDGILGKNSLGDSYPNPNHSEVHIPYCVSESATFATIKVYTVLGVEVLSVVLTNLGNSEIKLDTSSLSAGIYVYSLLVDGRTMGSKNLQVAK